jgi:hypothetical protein
MVMCSMVHCPDPPVGGFQEVLDARHTHDPGPRMLWCSDHESLLRPQTFAKQGYYLSADQIPKE